VPPSRTGRPPPTCLGAALPKTRHEPCWAFAAEFLCPINELTDFLRDDFSNEAIEDAGESFGISPTAVRSHLVNSDILPVEALVA
jgi:hypothetical protein